MYGTYLNGFSNFTHFWYQIIVYHARYADLILLRKLINWPIYTFKITGSMYILILVVWELPEEMHQFHSYLVLNYTMLCQLLWCNFNTISRILAEICDIKSIGSTVNATKPYYILCNIFRVYEKQNNSKTMPQLNVTISK